MYAAIVVRTHTTYVFTSRVRQKSLMHNQDHGHGKWNLSFLLPLFCICKTLCEGPKDPVPKPILQKQVRIRWIVLFFFLNKFFIQFVVKIINETINATYYVYAM